MRVLLLSDSRECGGVETHLLSLAEELRSRGHRLSLATSGDPRLRPFLDAIAPTLSESPLTIALDSRRGWRAAARLSQRLLLRSDALVVSAHSTLSCYYPLWLASLLDCPSLLIQQLIDPEAPLNPITRSRRAQHLRKCRAIVAVSEAVRRDLCTLFGEGLRSSIVIPNGADTQRFLPPATPSPERDTPLLCVARLSPQKGLDVLLRALADLAAERPAASLLIAGEGPERSRLQGLIRELGLEGRVRLLGQLSDVPAFLRRGQILVLPSLEEGLPLAAAEGMAAGLCIVATRVGGTAELVEEGSSGFLVPPGDPEALKQALIRAMDLSPRERWVMGRKGRKRVLESYEARVGSRRIAELVESLHCPATERAGPERRRITPDTDGSQVEPPPRQTNR